MEHEIRIMRRIWRLVFAPGLAKTYGFFGECDDPSKRKKCIRIDPLQTDDELLDTLLHEMGHAAMPWATEEFVAQFASDQTKAVKLMFKLERISHATEEADRESASGHAPRSGPGSDATG